MNENQFIQSPNEVESLNMYDEWQKLYDEVSTELELRTFTLAELFNHCLKTCNKIFKICEHLYGKKPKNIPDDFIEKIAILYEEKRRVCVSGNMPTGKYDYPTSCENFPAEKFSLSDLARVIFKDIAIQKTDYTRNIMWQQQEKYLTSFFGVQEIRKATDSAEAYETLRLLKIRNDCKYECGVDLGCLLHLSLMNQKNHLHGTYTTAFNFIKERILVRHSDSNYSLDFKIFMELENYNHFLRGFLNYFSDEIITCIIKKIKKLDCKLTRRLCEIMYTTVISIFKEIPIPKASVINDPKALQVYAYEHFLMIDVHNPDYAEFYSKIFQVEAPECFYTKLEQFLNKNQIDAVKIADIEDFVEQHKKELVEIIYPKVVSDKDRRKYLKRISRHQKLYGILGRIYNRGLNKPISENLQGFETVTLIYLYEFLADKNVEIPLHSGYTKEKRRRNLKINQLITKIQINDAGKETSRALTEEEYFLACYWLTEQMYTLINYRTIKIQKLREEMKAAILKYLLATVPLITTQKKSVNPAELIAKIAIRQVFKQIDQQAEQFDTTVIENKFPTVSKKFLAQNLEKILNVL